MVSDGLYAIAVVGKGDITVLNAAAAVDPLG